MKKVCQSCGMPLAKGLFGTETDGSESDLYCTYCFRGGKFTRDVTLEEMAERCSAHLLHSHPEYSPQQAKEYMLTVLPQLLRWKK